MSCSTIFATIEFCSIEKVVSPTAPSRRFAPAYLRGNPLSPPGEIPPVNKTEAAGFLTVGQIEPAEYRAHRSWIGQLAYTR
jgi:hypothetical protein